MIKYLLLLIAGNLLLGCASTPELVIDTTCYWDELEKDPTDTIAIDSNEFFDSYTRRVDNGTLYLSGGKRQTPYDGEFVNSFDSYFEELGITPVHKKIVTAWAVINKTKDIVPRQLIFPPLAS
jgi:hypothetical protein